MLHGAHLIRLLPLTVTVVAVIAASVTGLVASGSPSSASTHPSTYAVAAAVRVDGESITELRRLAAASRDEQRTALTSQTVATPTATPSPTPTIAPIVDTFAPVAGCTAVVPAATLPNGRLSEDQLCSIGDGQLLRADAAATFIALDAAYRAKFGSVICVTDSYRSYSSQVSLYAQKPSLAAVPGTSNHGWGVAVDVFCGIDSYSSAEHAWMTANAPAFGWTNPDWALDGGSREEPWHWEFDASLLG